MNKSKEIASGAVVEQLVNMHMALGQERNDKLGSGMVAYTFSASSWEAEAGG